jgi:predicted DNA binding CopG/RHH family protein
MTTNMDTGMITTTRKKGRPKEPYPADKRIHVRCQTAQLAEIHRRASDAGMTFSEYVLACCLDGLDPDRSAASDA